MITKKTYLNSLINEEINKLFVNEIKEYNDNEIIANNEIDLQHEYNKSNQQLFGNELPKVPLKWSNRKTSLGHIRVFRNRLTGEYRIDYLAISGFYKTSYHLFKNTLAHEMIHIKTCVTGKRDWGGAHGFVFLKEAARINNMGLGYKITIANSEEIDVSDDVKQNMKTLIGIILNLDGNYYLSVTTPNVFNAEFDSVINLFERIVNQGKYNSIELTAVETKNPLLVTYRQTRSYKRTFKYRKLSDDLLEQLLDDKIIKNIRLKKGTPPIISEDAELPDNSGNWEVMDIV